MSQKAAQIEGEIYGDYIVLSIIKGKYKNSRWLCKCLLCDEIKEFSITSLKKMSGIKCKYKTFQNETIYRKHIIKKIIQNRNITQDGCWEWTKWTYKDGYGRINYRRKNQRVHRLSYEFFIGSIPDKMFICHRCDNRICFNPEHLFLGDHKSNAIDMVKKGRHHAQKYSSKYFRMA